MKRRNLAMIACTVMAIGLTACGGNGNQGADEPASEEALQIETVDETQENTTEELEERLVKYRAERETMTDRSLGNGVSGYGAPNAGDYGFSSDESEYLLLFDARELSEAYEAAKNYVTNTLGISVETKGTVYPCVDPRMTEIYEAVDKGVANGYEPENIFICEYCETGEWHYLILVREAKGEQWKVIYHGNSYKEEG